MKTTKKNFDLFRKECEYWMDEFGLKGWELKCYHTKTKPRNLARTSFNTVQRWVCTTLNVDWGKYPTTDYDIKRTAFHEVVEGALLANIRALAEERYTTQDQIDEEIHNLVRVLENTVFDKGLRDGHNRSKRSR